MSDVKPQEPVGAGDRSEDVRWPDPGEPGVEILHPRFGPAAAVVFLIPWAFPLFIFTFCSLVPGFLLAEAIVGDGPFVALLGLGLTACFGAALIWLLLWWRAQVYRRTTITLSPVGVRLRDHRGLEFRLRWQDVTGIGRLSRRLGHTLLARAVEASYDVIAGQVQLVHPATGLIGWGTRTVPPKMPRREQQFLSNQRRDRKTGKYELLIPLDLAGPVTPHNRMLAYTMHHRPDLVAPPQ